MNSKLVLLSLAGLFSPYALAELPEPAASTTISCQGAHWPTQSEVAHYLQAQQATPGESDANTQCAIDAQTRCHHHPEADRTADIRRVRQHIRSKGRHECRRGARYVRVDFYRPGQHVGALTQSSKKP